jgi:hypothetical protein
LSSRIEEEEEEEKKTTTTTTNEHIRLYLFVQSSVEESISE